MISRARADTKTKILQIAEITTTKTKASIKLIAVVTTITEEVVARDIQEEDTSKIIEQVSLFK